LSKDKPIIITLINQYDDIDNITKCYNKHLCDLSDYIIIIYGNVDKYPKLSLKQELKEMDTIQKQLITMNQPFVLITNEKDKDDKYVPFSNKKDMVQTLFNKGMETIIKNIDYVRKDQTKDTHMWFMRIASDEEINKELKEELYIISELDYLNTIYFSRIHMVDGKHLIVGSGGFAKNVKFCPRLIKTYDGKQFIHPTITHHHDYPIALFPKQNNKMTDYAQMGYVTTVKPLIHWGHSKKKSSMNRKATFYKKRNDYVENIEDNYVPCVDCYKEKELRYWYQNGNFESIVKITPRKV